MLKESRYTSARNLKNHKLESLLQEFYVVSWCCINQFAIGMLQTDFQSQSYILSFCDAIIL